MTVTQLITEPKRYKVSRDTVFVDWIISAMNSIEETIEAPIVYVTDIAEFCGLWMPERVAVSEVDELTGLNLRCFQGF